MTEYCSLQAVPGTNSTLVFSFPPHLPAKNGSVSDLTAPIWSFVGAIGSMGTDLAKVSTSIWDRLEWTVFADQPAAGIVFSVTRPYLLPPIHLLLMHARALCMHMYIQTHI